MDVGRPPGVWVVSPRVGAWLDGEEAVVPFRVGLALAHPDEVRVEGSRERRFPPVHVASAGVRLPYLDDRVRYPVAVLVQHPSGDDDPLAYGRAPGSGIGGQVGVLGSDLRPGRARTRRLRESGDHLDRVVGRASLDRRLVVRLLERRVVGVRLGRSDDRLAHRASSSRIVHQSKALSPPRSGVGGDEQDLAHFWETPVFFVARRGSSSSWLSARIAIVIMLRVRTSNPPDPDPLPDGVGDPPGSPGRDRSWRMPVDVVRPSLPRSLTRPWFHRFLLGSTASRRSFPPWRGARVWPRAGPVRCAGSVVEVVDAGGGASFRHHREPHRLHTRARARLSRSGVGRYTASAGTGVDVR